MAKRSKSSVLIASNLGCRKLVFDEDDVVRLLRAAVEREGGQTAFAKRHSVDRAFLNRILNGKRPVSGAFARQGTVDQSVGSARASMSLGTRAPLERSCEGFHEAKLQSLPSSVAG